MNRLSLFKSALVGGLLASLGLVVFIPHRADALVGLQGNAAPDKVFVYDTGVYYDRTGSGTFVNYGKTTGNYAVYIGTQAPMEGLSFQMNNWGTGTAGTQNLDYYYSGPSTFLNPGGFSALPLSSNPSNDFKISNASNIATVTFDPKTNWTKQTINGVSAYWVKIVSSGPSSGYTLAPASTNVKATVYNLKVQVNDEDGTPNTDDLVWNLDSTCGLDSPAVSELNAGNGVHYVALRSDNGSCTLSTSVFARLTFQTTVTGLTTSVKDLTSTPFVLNYPTKVVVADESGNLISNAGVYVNNPAALSSTITSGNSYMLAGDFQNAVLYVTANGYVTEDGSAGNTAFSTVNSGASTMQTVINLASPNAACTGSVASGVTVSCAPLRRDEVMTVQANGAALSGAMVTMYTDSGMTVIANDIAQTKGIHNATDASNTTDANGVVKMALASGTYYYKIVSAGNPDKTGSITVTSGVANSQTVDVVAPVAPPASAQVSTSQSTVVASPLSVVADGSQTTLITVALKDASGNPITSGVAVWMSSSLNGVTYSPSVTSDASGMATFTAKSTAAGSAQFTVNAGGLSLLSRPTVQFTAVPSSPSSPSSPSAPSAPSTPGTCSYQVGSLVKLPNDGNPNTQEDTAVYFYGSDCKRHAFSNDKVYFTWYTNFNSVMVVSAQTLASMPLGKNVTYRPGVKLVKFASLNNVYAVSHGGVLRWVATEAAASGLYGSTWNKKVDDISDAFFVNYTFGANINAATDFNITTELQNALTIGANM